MLVLETIVEIPQRTAYPVPWSLPDPPYPSSVRLHGHMTDLELGLVVAELARYRSVQTERSPTQMLERFVQRTSLVVAGGLQARKGDLVIAPSCCCGLETWREWVALTSGENRLWMGHSPSPWVEQTAAGYRLWSDEFEQGSVRPPDVYAIDFSQAELRRAVTTVQIDLLDFLAELNRWAGTLAPDVGPAFAQAIDRAFEISHPAQ